MSFAGDFPDTARAPTIARSVAATAPRARWTSGRHGRGEWAT